MCYQKLYGLARKPIKQYLTSTDVSSGSTSKKDNSRIFEFIPWFNCFKIVMFKRVKLYCNFPMDLVYGILCIHIFRALKKISGEANPSHVLFSVVWWNFCFIHGNINILINMINSYPKYFWHWDCTKQMVYLLVKNI